MIETILIIIGVVSLFLLLLLLFCRPAIDNASDTMENTNSKIGWNSFSKLYFLFILLMASSYDFLLVACGNKGVAYILLNKISVLTDSCYCFATIRWLGMIVSFVSIVYYAMQMRNGNKVRE